MAAKRKSGIIARGKRKEAVARAYVQKGTGRVFVNKVALNSVNNKLITELVSEPFKFIDNSQFDIFVNMKGGGTSGQAQAARTAIARALIEASKDKEAREKMNEYDWSLLVEDTRRVEPKKFKGPKARARFTKSYR